MPHHSINGVDLWIVEEGSGPPLVFVHEFGGDHRVWREQIEHFRDRYRCVAYNARGYSPSDVPDDEYAYGVEIALADLLGVLDALEIDKAHLVGLSMGAYNILRFALDHPERVLTVSAASGGSGSYPPTRDHFLAETSAVADQFLASEKLADTGLFDGPTRIQLKAKRPEIWKEGADYFAGFSPKGAGYTLRRVQVERPSLYDFEAELGALAVPVLLMIGDEDELVIETNVFLKRAMPMAGLLVLPKSGHLINLEDPDIFNRAIDEFHAAVADGNWPSRPSGSTAANAYNPEETS
ncbi:MAG: alpha/beta fold hydrolase [Planctomycetota bacterium]|jgi:pimeloyl-ACP methyl ester carboxylesterase